MNKYKTLKKLALVGLATLITGCDSSLATKPTFKGKINGNLVTLTELGGSFGEDGGERLEVAYTNGTTYRFDQYKSDPERLWVAEFNNSRTIIYGKISGVDIPKFAKPLNDYYRKKVEIVLCQEKARQLETETSQLNERIKLIENETKK